MSSDGIQDCVLMTEPHKKIINKNFTKLADNLTVDSILNDFIAESIITNDEHEDLLEDRPGKRAGKFLRLIMKREDRGFYVLIKGCNRYNMGHLAKLLENEECSPASKPVAKHKLERQPSNTKRNTAKAAKKTKSDHQEADADSDYSSSEEGFDVSDEPFDVNVKECSEDFYNAHRKEAYKMGKKEKGKALIVNVNKVKGHDPRSGTDVDRDNLKQLFEQLQMEVTVLNDEDGLTAQEIEDKTKEFAMLEEHSDSLCCMLAMLSHGGDGHIYGTDAKKVNVDKLRSFFTSRECSTLQGKPKLVLIQACRGKEADDGVDHPLDVDEADDLMASGGDEIVGFPTRSGFKSWRHNKKGSWFISAVVHVFQKHAHNETVFDLLSKVNGIVRRRVTDTLKWETRNKTQMCEVHSTLGKKWYLFPGIEKEDQ